MKTPRVLMPQWKRQSFNYGNEVTVLADYYHVQLQFWEKINMIVAKQQPSK